MKATIKKAVLTIAAVSCLTITNAQKIAHLSFDSLLSLMPETKTVSEMAQSYLDGLKQEMTSMQGEMDSKYKDYLEKEPGMSELIKKTKQEQLQQLQTRIQDFQGQAEMDFKRKQAELTAPIMAKAKKGVDAVAKEEGYKYVVDTSKQNTTVLYSEQTDDILAAVKKKLDAMPLAIIPGAADKTPPPAGNKPPAPKGGK